MVELRDTARVLVRREHDPRALKVEIVESFPDDCGQWRYVESFPDVKIQFVESFPDVKVQMVTSFPGWP